MKVDVTVTSVTQSANEVLGKAETKLYYLIIQNGDMKAQINVGEKTYNSVKALTEPQPEKPKGGK